jgi:hypothetical protein
MKSVMQGLLIVAIIIQTASGQLKADKNYRNFPIVLSVQFHSLSRPFKNLASNFKNIGFGIGTELALGSGHDWAQQFQFSWYRNKEAGNGILLYTQSAWRPTLVSHVYTELKGGFGYTILTATGKWRFTVPVGVSVGYNRFSPSTYVAPFASYQILVSPGKTKILPPVTNTLWQLGARIHPE